MRRRCLAFDYGLKSTGLAIGDTATGVVQALGAIKMTRGRPNWVVLEGIIQQWGPHILVVGLPLHADGRVQAITQQAKAFSEKLQQHFNYPVDLVDERYSTLEARSIIFERSGSRALKKDVIDAQAAVVLCKQWMSRGDATG